MWLTIEVNIIKRWSQQVKSIKKDGGKFSIEKCNNSENIRYWAKRFLSETKITAKCSINWVDSRAQEKSGYP